MPPELEEMLRAELSRKQPAAPMNPPVMSSAESMASPGEVTEAKPVRRTRTTKAKSAEESTGGTASEPAAAPVKATRTRTTKAAATGTTPPRTRKAAPAAADGEAAPKKPATRRKAATVSEPGAEMPSEATEG